MNKLILILIFIDEAGINLWVQRTRGRARRGEWAIRRESNFTVVFAVSCQCDRLLHDTFEGGMACGRFMQFPQQLSAAHPNRHMVFIYDNAPAYRQAHLPPGDGGPVMKSQHSVYRPTRLSSI